jgi:hypothetical protein
MKGGPVAYKTFVAGEEALASDVNSLLMSQTVSRFPTAAARDIPSPVVNQLSMVDTRPGIISYWTGSAWADIAPLERFVSQAPNITVVPGGTNSDVWANVVAPFTGKLVVNAIMLIAAGAGAGNNYAPSIGATGGTPAASYVFPAQQGIVLGGALASVPLLAVWETVTAGTNVSIRWQLTVAGNTSSGVVAAVSGTYRWTAG